MAPTARFSIEKVFDLEQRSGLLASGKVLEGEIAAGTVLWDEETGARTTVLAVEFETRAERENGRTTLLLERTDPTPVAPNRILSSTT